MTGVQTCALPISQLAVAAEQCGGDPSDGKRRPEGRLAGIVDVFWLAGDVGWWHGWAAVALETSGMREEAKQGGGGGGSWQLREREIDIRFRYVY